MTQTQIDVIGRRARELGYVAWLPNEQVYVNLAGTYDYLEQPYYLSQDRETAGVDIHPTCKEMLDGYITPVFLEKGRLAGLPVADYYVSNGYFESPVVIDPINPFMIRSRIIRTSGHGDSVARSMTRNFTYAVCCQELPEGAKLTYFRAVLGWCEKTMFRDLAASIWDVYRIPVARVRVMVMPDGRLLLSDLAQLPFDKLNRSELAHIDERVSWDK